MSAALAVVWGVWCGGKGFDPAHGGAGSRDTEAGLTKGWIATPLIAPNALGTKWHAGVGDCAPPRIRFGFDTAESGDWSGEPMISIPSSGYPARQ
jgi:hypothetical protein